MWAAFRSKVAGYSHRDWGAAAALTGVGLVVVLGWWHSLVAGLPLWHGIYCAVATATTNGGDCPLGGQGYLIASIEFFTVVPLFALSLTLFTSHFINQGAQLRTDDIKQHVTATFGQQTPAPPPGDAGPPPPGGPP
jgi:hypothetical protein